LIKKEGGSMGTNTKLRSVVLVSAALTFVLIVASSTAVAVGQPAGQGSPIAAITYGGEPRVYYSGNNEHIYELAVTTKGWVFNELTKVTGGESAGQGSPIAATTYGGNPRVYYSGNNGHIYELVSRPFNY
jgi:hypothetical protein